jgi:hypothetical protein
MQKPQVQDSDSAAAESGATPTPRVSGEVPAGPSATDTPMPESSTRKAELPDAPSVPSEPTDTLLSAGKPADRLELLLEDRLAVVDERLQQLDLRLTRLEQTRPTTAPQPAARQKPWLWLVFLIALAAVFQLLRALN